MTMRDQRLREAVTQPQVHSDSAGLQINHSSRASASSYGMSETANRAPTSLAYSSSPEPWDSTTQDHGLTDHYQQPFGPSSLQTANGPPEQSATSMAPTTIKPITENGTNLQKQTSRKNTIFWIVLLTIAILIIAAIAGGVAAKYIIASKRSAQTVAASGSLIPSDLASTQSYASQSATLVNGPVTVTAPASTQSYASQSATLVNGPVTVTVPVPASTQSYASQSATLMSGPVTQATTTMPPALTNVPASIGTATLTITKAPTSSPKNPCTNTLAFTSTVSWAGVASPINPSQVYWLYNLPDGQACCNQCWNLSPQRCNVWGYFPYGHPVDNKVSCAVVYDYPGSQVDGTCPAGRPQVGILPPGPNDPYDASKNVGGPGPCAGLIYSAA